MAAEDCIRLIREQAPDLTDEEIEEILSELQRRLEARRAGAQLESLEDALLDEGDALAEEIVEAAQIERRNRLINIKTKADLRQTTTIADAALDDPSMGLEARMVGVNAPFPGARKSVDARGKGLFAEYAGGMIADLRREGVLTLFNGRHLEREIAQELEQITLPNGERGISGSTEARKIAEIIEKYRKVSVARQNRAGAWIKPLPGYITRQTHDMHRLRRAGFEDWRDSILPLLDEERTFQGADANEFLRAAYDGLVTGQHHRLGADNDLEFAFKGPGNLAKRISQHRVLHFKNADAWFDYNERFGTRSLSEAIIQDLERSARNTALMETFGTNPRAMFDSVLDDLKQEFRGDLEKFDRLNERRLQNQISEIDGTASIPVNPSFARLSSGVRAVQTLSKLGGAFLSAIADLAFSASEVRFQKGNLLGSWGDTLNNLVQGLPTNAQRREVAELIGVGLDGQIGDVAARWTAQDDIAGRTAKIQRIFFKLNLLGPWTDANKRGMGLMMARDLAMKSGDDWASIDVRTKRILELYGFDAAKWDIARQAVREAEDGRAYLMPDAIDELPDTAFGDMEPRAIRKLRDEIRTGLTSYYVDRADFASPTPGGRERAIMRQGLQPGTPMGEAVRFMMQFKGFPITALTKPLGRDVFGGGAKSFRDAMIGGKADFTGLAHMIVATTVLGYLAQSAKELSKGRSPRDPADHMTWTSAMLQGGGLGLYGDFLLGETNRFGRSLLDTLAGPTFGTIADLDELRARAIAGEDKAAGAVRFLMGNMPFVNLFYTRMALDYMIFYQIQEAMNPGYLRRMERRIERENNQEFIVPPSKAA